MKFEVVNVEDEYIKDDQLKRDDVRALMEWVEGQAHLPKPTELQLVLFLNSCRYDTEMTKKVIEKYYTLYTLYIDDFFAVPDNNTIEDALKKMLIKTLPEQTPEGSTVLIIKIVDNDPASFDQQNLFRFSMAVVSLHLLKNGTNKGLLLVFDFECLGFGHLMKLNLSMLRKILQFTQEACPLWIKNIHLINMNGISMKFVAVLKPFVKKEFYDLFVLHSTELDTLYKYIPKRCFPKDMGGNAPTITQLSDAGVENLKDNVELLHWMNTQRVDESKRPEKMKSGFWSRF